MAPTRMSVLNDVYVETISMDDIETKKAKKIVKEFVIDVLIEEMKMADKTFKSLFQRVVFSGSFYDGLRVGQATEFDLNVVLKLPFYRDAFDLIIDTSSDEGQFFGVVPASAVYSTDETFQALMPRSHPRYADFQRVEKFFECVWYSGVFRRQHKYVLRPDEVSKWFQSVVYKVQHRIIKKYTSWLGRRFYGDQFRYSDTSDYIRIRFTKAGPAYTLHINCYSGMNIDVDLVPVIEPIYSEIVLVPKPYKENVPRLWRLSYPYQEKRIFHDRSCAKKVVKLLKRFRDMQGAPWKKLSSYYLKTVVMNVMGAGWSDRQLDQVFMSCLYRLLGYLEDGKIPFYFDENCNLLKDVHVSTIQNMAGRLKRIVKDIETNPPETLRKYFCTEECCTETIDGSQPSWCIIS